MGLFRNPMEAEYTFKQKTSFVFWAIFSISSIHCSAQSINKTYSLDQWLSYVIATAIVAGATLCLFLIKRSMDEGYVERRKLKLFLGFPVFLILWFCIVAVNTHFIYVKMTGDRMRLSELNTVRKNFD